MHTGFGVVVEPGHAAAQAALHAAGQGVEALPIGAEFAGLRALVDDAETAVFEKLSGARPYFSRNPLGDQPAGVATVLQAEFADVTRHGQCLRARYVVLALHVAVANVLGNRQQRVEALGLDIGGQLHRRSLPCGQVITAAIAEVAIFAPDPATATGAGDDQSKCGKSGQSLHAS